MSGNISDTGRSKCIEGYERQIAGPVNTLLDVLFHKYGEDGTFQVIKEIAIGLKVDADYLHYTFTKNDEASGIEDKSPDEVKEAVLRRIGKKANAEETIRAIINDMEDYIKLLKIWFKA